jgi:hypothetical protein
VNLHQQDFIPILVVAINLRCGFNIFLDYNSYQAII